MGWVLERFEVWLLLYYDFLAVFDHGCEAYCFSSGLRGETTKSLKVNRYILWAQACNKIEKERLRIGLGIFIDSCNNAVPLVPSVHTT